jgi:feruloyl esterase
LLEFNHDEPLMCVRLDCKERSMNMKSFAYCAAVLLAGLAVQPVSSQPGANKVITAADCTAEKLGASIPASAIGEPVSAVTLDAPTWHEALNETPAYCRIEGSMAPIDKSPTARPILFGVVLPAEWSHRATQMGGGGMNGTIPGLTFGFGPGGSPLAHGFAVYGSDSGHHAGGFGPMPANMPMGGAGRVPGAPQSGAPNAGPGAAMPPRPAPDPHGDEWALNDEAIGNLAYMQLKKTHDAAMVLIQRIYGEQPRWNYFFGNSQGGREALTVVQRYPNDYDGVSAEVPIVSFTSLMLGPALIRIQEKPAANWVPPAKARAIAAEILRQCDKLDGLVDGIINNYMACRAIFDVTQGAPGRNPWSAKRCPENTDPNPADTSTTACLTDGQISTVEFIFSHYRFATPLSDGKTTFGMWLPGTDPGGFGMLAGSRFRGQEGAASDAPIYGSMGSLGVTGFLMKDLKANPLDYVEGGRWNQRREELSRLADSTNPDLSAFAKHGGKLLVVIGTNDTIASPGAQLDYYRSVIDKMGQSKVDSFARLWVLPQTDHGLHGRSANLDGDGKTITSQAIPSKYDRFALLTNWVEENRAPEKQVVVTSGDRSLPMCSYPTYPKYVSGDAGKAESYICSAQ